jgi:hypothetical protein
MNVFRDDLLQPHLTGGIFTHEIAVVYGVLSGSLFGAVFPVVVAANKTAWKSSRKQPAFQVFLVITHTHL